MSQFAGASISHLWDSDQWAYIRQNLGEWRGSFIQFSLDAIQVSETPSVLTLNEDRPGQHMTLVLKRTPQGKNTHTTERDLGYPGAIPYICFFPTGAFCQGAMHRRAWSSFGSEFSLLSDNRRIRLVQLYTGTASGDHTLDYVTLIPECRSPATAEISEIGKTRLGIDTLIGTWQGESLYLSATMETPLVGASRWQAERVEDGLVLSQHADVGPQQLTPQRFTSIDQHRWQAVDNPQQLWLLPGDVSCTVYPQLPRQHGPRLEFCWYLSSQQRQRIVRDYDAVGDWIGTSLALETRI